MNQEDMFSDKTQDESSNASDLALFQSQGKVRPFLRLRPNRSKHTQIGLRHLLKVREKGSTKVLD